MDYKKITDEIIEKSGGEENIISLSHCMTRLRFVLKDEAKANLEMLKSTEGVLGAVFGAGQLQVVMGQHVSAAFNSIMKRYRFSDGENKSENNQNRKPTGVKGILMEGVNFLAGSVSPMITALIAGGMLKLLLLIIAMITPAIEKTSTYTMINFLADVPFYFMPVFLAYGASRKLGCNPIYAMFVACALIYPGFIALVESGGSTNLFGLPVLLVKYSSTMLPALLATVAVYWIEKFFDKILPGMLKNVLGGMLTVLVASVLTFVAFGPIGTYLGEVIVNVFLWLQDTIGPLVVGVMAAVLPFLIMTGTHTVFAPLMVQSLANPGYDPFVKPALIIYAMAMGGASLGVALRVRNKKTRSEALAIGTTAIFAGITEPGIYGIALKYKKPFIGVMAGGASGGIVAGLMGAKAYIYGKTTILALPIFMDTMVAALIGCIVAILVSGTVTYLLGIDEEPSEELNNSVLSDVSKAIELEIESDIKSIVDGVSIPLTDVKDEVFSKKMMGDGIAFTLEGNVVVSPCNGVLSSVSSKGHAFGISRDDGVELLIHIGINTVSLKGKGFDVRAEQGMRINAGDELVVLDLNYLKSTGLDLSTMLIFVDKSDKEVEFSEYTKVTRGESVVAEIK